MNGTEFGFSPSYEAGPGPHGIAPVILMTAFAAYSSAAKPASINTCRRSNIELAAKIITRYKARNGDSTDPVVYTNHVTRITSRQSCAYPWTSAGMGVFSARK